MQFHSSYKCAETSELNVFHGHTCIQHSMFLGKRVIQTNPSKFDERLFSDIYMCRLRLKQGREIHYFIFWGRVPEGRSSEGYASFK